MCRAEGFFCFSLGEFFIFFRAWNKVKKLFCLKGAKVDTSLSKRQTWQSCYITTSMMHLVFRVQRGIKTHLGEHGCPLSYLGHSGSHELQPLVVKMENDKNKDLSLTKKKRGKKMSFPHFLCLIKYLHMFSFFVGKSVFLFAYYIDKFQMFESHIQYWLRVVGSEQPVTSYEMSLE